MATKAKKPKKAQASQVAVTGRVQVQVIADVNITASMENAGLEVSV